MNILKYPLSNVQMEILKLFSTNMSDSEMKELKSLLSRFYADKAIQAADHIWDTKGFSNEDMNNLLNGKS